MATDDPRKVWSPARDPEPVRHGRALALLAIIVAAIVLAGCDATTPGPDVGCYPNHSGVCEGPPLTADEAQDAWDAHRRIQARDTTNGRDISL